MQYAVLMLVIVNLSPYPDNLYSGHEDRRSGRLYQKRLISDRCTLDWIKGTFFQAQADANLLTRRQTDTVEQKDP